MSSSLKQSILHLVFAPALAALSLSLFQPVALSGQEPAAEPASAQAVYITDNRTDGRLELAQLVDRLKSADVIFLGEKHDNDAGHQFQLEVIQALHAAGCDLAIGMEQFERDVQGAVDDYLAGKISEEEFLAVSRPWKNYPEHYRAIVEFAKTNRLPILAGNLPRKLATAVSEGKTLEPHQMAFAARNTLAPKDRYWDNFVRTMQGHMGADGNEMMIKFYASQCAKDDAMAEAITDHLVTNRHRPRKVVQLCGHFHSDYGLGTVARVQSRLPLMHSVVVTMEMIPEAGAKPADKEWDRANFTLWTIPNKAKPE
ncbi:MAG: ChaN family lipoprotein [Planctomycetota bacterium]